MANFKNELTATLNMLIAQREAWETGSYKKATDDLYAILEQCGTIYEAVRSDKGNARALTAVADDMGIAFTKGTGAALKVVRVVFGKQGNREFAYARVLKAWFEERAADQSVTNFLIERGGIESVRRASSQKALGLTSDEYRDIAAKLLVGGKPFATLPVNNLMVRDDKNDTDYIVAIVRNNKGTGELVYATNKASLVNAALAVTGKELDELQKQDASKIAITERHDATLNNLQQFITVWHKNIENLSAA
jgi:hypothetical protein